MRQKPGRAVPCAVPDFSAWTCGRARGAVMHIDKSVRNVAAGFTQMLCFVGFVPLFS
jgi:hypothetical protein